MASIEEEVKKFYESVTESCNNLEKSVTSAHKNLMIQYESLQKENDILRRDVSDARDDEKRWREIVEDDAKRRKEATSWRELASKLFNRSLRLGRDEPHPSQMPRYARDLYYTMRPAVMSTMREKNVVMKDHLDRDTIEKNIELMGWFGKILCGNSYFDVKEDTEVKRNTLLGCAICFILDISFTEQCPREQKYRSLIAECQGFLKELSPLDNEYKLITDILEFFSYKLQQKDPQFEKEFPVIANRRVLEFFKTISLIATMKNSLGEEEEIISAEGVVHPDLTELADKIEEQSLKFMRLFHKIRQRFSLPRIHWPTQETSWRMYMEESYGEKPNEGRRKLITILPAFFWEFRDGFPQISSKAITHPAPLVEDSAEPPEQNQQQYTALQSTRTEGSGSVTPSLKRKSLDDKNSQELDAKRRKKEATATESPRSSLERESPVGEKIQEPEAESPEKGAAAAEQSQSSMERESPEENIQGPEAKRLEKGAIAADPPQSSSKRKSQEEKTQKPEAQKLAMGATAEDPPQSSSKRKCSEEWKIQEPEAKRLKKEAAATEPPLRSPPRGKTYKKFFIYENGDPEGQVVSRNRADPARDGQPSLDLYIKNNGYWPRSNRSRTYKNRPDSAK